MRFFLSIDRKEFEIIMRNDISSRGLSSLLCAHLFNLQRPQKHRVERGLHLREEQPPTERVHCNIADCINPFYLQKDFDKFFASPYTVHCIEILRFLIAEIIRCIQRYILVQNNVIIVCVNCQFILVK